MFQFLLGVGLGFAANEYLKRNATGGGGGMGKGGGAGEKWGGTYQLATANVGGAQDGDNVPVVFLLHGQASNPEEALEQFKLERPAEIVVPIATYPQGGPGRFSYWDPSLGGDARDKAQRDAVANLKKAIDAFLADRKPSPARAIVIGLDASGPLAAELALTDPLNIRYAWATGGAFPESWVPAKAPILNNLETPQVFKLTYGNAVAGDQAAAKLAAERDMPFWVTVVNGQPSAQAWLAWMLPTLEPLLTTP